VSTGKVFKYENRLAGSLVTKGGLSAGDAVRQAEAAVEQVRQPTIAAIDEALAEILALGEQLQSGADARALDRMYDCGNRVVALGGVFGLDDLGKAAYSLCELISQFQSLGRFQWAMIRVHLDGLKLLRRPDEHAPEAREQVLAGLRQIAASVV
jgi:hypothetical protein